MESKQKRIIEEDEFVKITKYFDNKKRENPTFNVLMEKFEKKGDIIVIGGAVRDVILNQCEPRDIDLIIDTEESLDDILGSFKGLSRNRFGGYKLTVDNLEIDVWSIKNHWAFKENIIEQSFDNIQHTTFLNFDAVLYNLTKRIGRVDVFNETIITSCLDITLEDEFIYKNPSISTNIARMLIIKDSWNLDFSERVHGYIQKWVRKERNPVNSLLHAQNKHYQGKRVISKLKVETELKKYTEVTMQ